jgi:prepilin-type N-terminal cleavage/methylation domain-containing protein
MMKPRRTHLRPRATGLSRRRSGYSLAELLVAVVLLGIVGGALSRLVVDQMRFFDNVQVMRGARSAARNSMNVMLSELRMVQDSGGVTNIAGDNKSITVLVPYRMGVLCGTTAGISTVSMLPIDSATLALASFGGYGYRVPATGRFAVTQTTTPPVASATSLVCTTTAGISTITINGRAGAILDIPGSTIPATTTSGAPVMFFQSITYSFAASTLYPGKIGLFRRVGGGTAEELMAPFASSARFRYYQTGDDTSRTTAPALSDIRGIALVLTAEGARRPAGRTSDAQSRMMTSIFFKNVRAF